MSSSNCLEHQSPHRSPSADSLRLTWRLPVLVRTSDSLAKSA